jgi:predicted DNA-binding helix-hairpin-helix protein
MNSGDKLHINVCSFYDLLGLPSVGKATAYKIWELRKSTEITPEILATISHLKMEKVLPLIDFSTSQEIAESWYLDKSEDESEEGLDDNMMAYVHQAEEILIKFVSDLLQVGSFHDEVCQ